jgi:dTDP-4-amino-4,6-dideoxygalactose transaminase
VIPFRDLARETAELRDELTRAVDLTLEESRFVFGGAVAEFERAFAATCGVSEVVGVGSGTDAIAIALRAAGIGPGDEVVTAANTCVPTVAGIAASGADAVLADVDPETLLLSPGAVEPLVGPRTRAIVPVHLYGRRCDMQSLLELARAHDLVVVEDASHAHGIRVTGDAAAFSFYPTKNLGAAGDAGAIATSRPDLAERARRLRVYGGSGFEDRAGQSRLDTIQAAMLLAKLPHLERWNARRAELASRYDAAFDVVSDGFHHLYVIRVSDRAAFRARVAERGVETAVHYERPIHHYAAWRDLRRGAVPESERAAAQVVSLPLYPQLTDDEADAVVAAVAA